MTEEYILILSRTKLFDGMKNNDIQELLICTGARTNNYNKNGIIISEQAEIRDIGVILAGRAFAYKSDPSGKRIIMSRLETGSVFGHILSAGENQKSPVAVTATEPVLALFIPFNAAITSCVKSCKRHERLLLNLLNIISGKYFELQDRISCIICPTLREKILYYLYSVSKTAEYDMFTIPFDRAAFAEYLNADRSALSRELSNMKKEGLIDYNGSSFHLLNHK